MIYPVFRHRGLGSRPGQHACRPGDRVLMAETGQFSTLWVELAKRLGFEVQLLSRCNWRRGADPDAIEAAALAEDAGRQPSKRSPSCTTRPPPASPRGSPMSDRPWIRAGHQALLMVDTISSLASIDYRHDEWGVDVTVAGSQKA